MRARRLAAQWVEEAHEKRLNKIPLFGGRVTTKTTQSPRINGRKPEREKRANWSLSVRKSDKLKESRMEIRGRLHKGIHTCIPYIQGVWRIFAIVDSTSENKKKEKEEMSCKQALENSSLRNYNENSKQQSSWTIANWTITQEWHTFHRRESRQSIKRFAMKITIEQFREILNSLAEICEYS